MNIDMNMLAEWVLPFVEHHQKNMVNYEKHPVLIDLCPGPYSRALAAFRLCHALILAMKALHSTSSIIWPEQSEDWPIEALDYIQSFKDLCGEAIEQINKIGEIDE